MRSLLFVLLALFVLQLAARHRLWLPLCALRTLQGLSMMLWHILVNASAAKRQ
jgi:hypothetical protein